MKSRLVNFLLSVLSVSRRCRHGVSNYIVIFFILQRFKLPWAIVTFVHFIEIRDKFKTLAKDEHENNQDKNLGHVWFFSWSHWSPGLKFGRLPEIGANNLLY